VLYNRPSMQVSIADRSVRRFCHPVGGLTFVQHRDHNIHSSSQRSLGSRVVVWTCILVQGIKLS
jgi:hypothetical protein